MDGGIETEMLVEPLVSVKLGLEEGGGVAVIVNVQGDGVSFDLLFRDMAYFAGVVQVLREAGEQRLRVETEGWERIAAEFGLDTAFTEDQLQRLLVG
jgi:hypothetical protein